MNRNNEDLQALPPIAKLKSWTQEAKAIKIDNSDNIVAGVLPLDRAIQFVESFAAEKEITNAEALLVLTLLFQTGATAKSCNPETAISYKSNRYTVKSLRTALSKCGLRNKSRQVARTLAPQILDLSIQHKIPGNLSRAIAKVHEIKETDKPYLSDFYPPEIIPNEIQRLINEHIQSRTKRR